MVADVGTELKGIDRAAVGKGRPWVKKRRIFWTECLRWLQGREAGRIFLDTMAVRETGFGVEQMEVGQGGPEELAGCANES